MGGQAIQASASNFRPPISTHHHHHSHHQPHLGSNTNSNHMDNDDEGVDVVGLDSSDNQDQADVKLTIKMEEPLSSLC